MRVALGDVLEDLQNVLLGVVHGLDYDHDQVGLGFQLGDLRRGVLARFAQAASIEKADEALFVIGEGVQAGGARAGPEAVADFRPAAAGHGLH